MTAAAIENKKLLTDRVRIDSGTMIFLIAWSIYLFASILTQSFYLKYLEGGLYKLILVGVAVLLMVKEYHSSTVGQQEARSLPLIMVLGGAFVLYAPAKSWMMLILFIIAARDIDLKPFFAVTACLSLAVLLLVVGSAEAGIITNYREQGTRVRYYLGFLYSLYGPMILENIIICYISWKKRNMSYTVLAFLLLLDLMLFSLTKSRLTGLLNLLLIGAAFVYRVGWGSLSGHKVLLFLMKYSWLLMAVFSIAVMVLYRDNAFFYRLDHILAGRLWNTSRSLKTFGVSLFGVHPEWNGNGLDSAGRITSDAYMYVDNLYLQCLQRFGILVTAVMLAAMTKVMKILEEDQEYMLMFLFAVLAVHAVIDDLVLLLFYNSMWIMIGPLFMKGKRKNRCSRYRLTTDQNT